ncbi:hypothetical protein NDU88_003374 [Pleurodeles waltl]|uniref:Uncharacterized protein n=1 Tax=Pleurodeles waltl TaxID=8319 RepID=A0AAV7M4Z5_PLEWA|nr:hypothetical protein NDU88_003374 [Pleurodeles waltl]
MSRSQPSTSATTSASAVIHASRGGSKEAPIRAASVPPTDVKDHPILPPAKVKKGPASSRGRTHHTPSKASPKHREDSARVLAATAKVGKGHKTKGKSPQGPMPPGEGLVTTIFSGIPATCTTVTITATTATCTAAMTATCTAATTATCTAASTTSVCSILPKDQPSEASGDGMVSPSTTPDTCTMASTGSISTTATATATCTTISTATFPANASISDVSSITSGQPSEAAGEVLDTPLEAPPPALARPAVGSRSRRRMECGSVSMEYHATCSTYI